MCVCVCVFGFWFGLLAYVCADSSMSHAATTHTNAVDVYRQLLASLSVLECHAATAPCVLVPSCGRHVLGLPGDGHLSVSPIYSVDDQVSGTRTLFHDVTWFTKLQCSRL